MVEQSLKNCGTLTGDLARDRSCLRDDIADIEGLEGVTGTITYEDSGDPAKCAIIGQIQEGTFRAVDSVCS